MNVIATKHQKEFIIEYRETELVFIVLGIIALIYGDDKLLYQITIGLIILLALTTVFIDYIFLFCLQLF